VQTRDALKQGFQAMSAGWRDIGKLSADARRNVSEGCQQATDALKQAVGQLCGW
jgi:hypothetical protein